MAIGDMIAPRTGFGEGLVELGQQNPALVVFDSDVCESTFTNKFRVAFPDRFYEMGIAEANMIGTAAGMSTLGFMPWVSTFAVFIAKRAVDQVRVSIAYPKLNVKLNGAYGGIPTGNAGATHQSVEDVAVMRAMPNMTVLVTADAVEAAQAVIASGRHEGPLYLRTARDPVPVIFDASHEFEIGRSYVLRQGRDVAIIANDMMTAKALDAAVELDKDGIQARVIHLPTIKPIDAEVIVKASREIGRVITVENHSRIGGLGGAVAEVLAEIGPCYQRRLGFPDTFGESGPTEAIFDKFGMNTKDIIVTAREMVRTL
jgi:transketolase